MAKFGKLIGAGLGWTFGGPIGAIIGLGIGWVYDSAGSEQTRTREFSHTTPGDFLVSMLVLIAAVMKADGKILKSELDFVKMFLSSKFDAGTTRDALRMLRDLLKQDIPVKDVTLQIRMRMEYHSRLELMHLLYGVARADGEFHPVELKLLDQIGYNLGLNSSDLQSLKSMFGHADQNAYKILGIDKNASIDEIKKAYRKLAVEFHPDKVSYLGEDIRKNAEEKFRKVNEAFEKIKKEKGIK